MSLHTLNFQPANEGFADKFIQHAQLGYQAGKGGMDKDIEKYAPVAQKYLGQVSDMAGVFSKKTGISLPLASALIASGVTGGVAAIPFAALLYFAKKPILGAAGKGFDVAWDAAASGLKKMQGAKQPNMALQPESFSFKEWLVNEEKEGWGDYLGRNIGHGVGRLAGNIAGLGSKVGSALKSVAKDIYQYVGNNPKQVAKAAFLVGLGAATGGVIGKLTHDLKDMVVQKIQDVMQDVPAEEVAWLRKNIVFERGVSDDGKEVGHVSDELLQQGDTPSSPESQAGYESDQPEMISAISKADNAAEVGPTGYDSKEFGHDVTGQTYDPEGIAHKSGLFRASHERISDKLGGQPQDDLNQAYRDIAKQMASRGETPTMMRKLFPSVQGQGGSMDMLRGMNVDPEMMKAMYGHSAGEEISKRLASPDTFSTPGMITGAAAGAKKARG